MRISSVISGLSKYARWAHDTDIFEAKVRGNYNTTIAQVDTVIAIAQDIIDTLKQKRGDSDIGNHTTSQSNILSAETLSAIVSATVVKTLDNLGYDLDAIKKDRAKKSDSTDDNNDTETSTKLKKRKGSEQTKTDNDRDSIDSESKEVKPELSAIVKSTVSESESKPKKHYDFKLIRKQFGIAIDAMSKFEFVHEAANAAKTYIKRWYDAISTRFREGTLKYGADKFGEAVTRFILAVTYHCNNGTLYKFDDEFSTWEKNMRNPRFTYALPREIAVMKHGKAHEVYGSDDILYEVFDEVYESGAIAEVSAKTHGSFCTEYIRDDGVYRLLG